MAKNKSKRKRAKLKRKDYRTGGNVMTRRGARPTRDDMISIGGPGGGRDNDPIAIGRPVAPPQEKQPVQPAPVAISSGPGFTTGDRETQEDYQEAARRGRQRGRGQGTNMANAGTFSQNGTQQNGGGEQNGGGGDQNGGDQNGDDNNGGGDDSGLKIGDTITVNGITYRWNGTNWVIVGQSDDDDSGGGGIFQDPLDNMSDLQKKMAFESERRSRNVLTGRGASDIAAGNIPEGTVPVPTVMGINREDTEATIEDGTLIQAPDAGQAETFTAPTTADEDVTQIAQDQVREVDPAREVTTTATPTETIEKAAQAKAAQEDEVRLARAAKVEDAPVVADVDVEEAIVTGAVADQVTGALSDDAKATVARNAGTDLARITRAKKQLRNAGLQESAITDLGNDPESLEDRLTDFTEEERGIIEGLPEEALVSNQLESLLTGIEEGEIPTWARPAVASVEAMLAKRGLQASSIARDALANTIIQASLPLAQANAQAIQRSVSEQRGIEAAVSEANAQRQQQVTLKNAESAFKIDVANMTMEQQTELANSKFLQTVSLTDANFEQQAAVQNAATIARADLADADFYQKAQIENAKAFLTTNMANLSNRQQSNVIKAQYEQQRLLSNQSAINAMGQFNATNDRQAQQFMAQIETQIRQYNAGYINATNQFNAQASNAAEARDAQRLTDVNRANAAIMNQVEQFNEQQNFNRQQWNSANAQAVINSNIDWRRRANTADTAAQNAVNQQNAQNAFGLTQAANSFLWQELRDQADYDFRWTNDTANRKLQAMMSAASAEGDAAKYWGQNFTAASTKINEFFS